MVKAFELFDFFFSRSIKQLKLDNSTSRGWVLNLWQYFFFFLLYSKSVRWLKVFFFDYDEEIVKYHAVESSEMEFERKRKKSRLSGEKKMDCKEESRNRLDSCVQTVVKMGIKELFAISFSIIATNALPSIQIAYNPRSNNNNNNKITFWLMI